MKAAFVTLGCKVNQYETNALRNLLLEKGFLPAGEDEEADVYIVNSCTVTAESSRKSRQALRKLRHEHPNAVTVLTGCYPQAYANKLTDLPEADIILGNKNNTRLPEAVYAFLTDRKPVVWVDAHQKTDGYSCADAAQFEGHTRAYIKIQDGCNRYCTYCIIPTSRGFSRSRPLGEIEEELKKIAEHGYKEVVFVGINLSSYGLDVGGADLTDAVALAEAQEGIERIRLGSLEPDHMTDEMLQKLSDFSKFCPQYHLSLQSGCDRILKRMNRHYDTAEFTELCRKLKTAFPGLSLTTDVICGFPGETEEEFLETVDYVRSTGFMKVHVFPFSPREGTPAAKMDGQITAKEKARRCRELQKTADEVRASFLRSLIGTHQSVLFETAKDGFQRGYTRNYTPVKLHSDVMLTGQIRTVLITGAEEDSVTGIIEG